MITTKLIELAHLRLQDPIKMRTITIRQIFSKSRTRNAGCWEVCAARTINSHAALDLRFSVFKGLYQENVLGYLKLKHMMQGGVD